LLTFVIVLVFASVAALTILYVWLSMLSWSAPQNEQWDRFWHQDFQWNLFLGGFCIVLGMTIAPLFVWQTNRRSHRLRDLEQALQQQLQQNALLKLTLQEQAQRWQLISHYGGIWEWNLHHSIISFSSQWKSMLGYADAEISDEIDEWICRIHPDDIDEVINALQAHLACQVANAQSKSFSQEYRIRCKDGHYKWVLNQAQADWDAEGQLQSLVGLHLDISHLKASEALNLKVENHALEQAKQAAEASNRIKSEFLATMSHEIRTPMTAVIGMTELLLETPLNPQQRNFVEIVRNSGSDLLTIINDILDFSKIEFGRVDLELHPFHLGNWLEEALDLFMPKVNEKNLAIAYHITPNTPTLVQGDATRLRQILVNLLSNAIKFTEVGSITVSISAHLQNPSQPKALNRQTSNDSSKDLQAKDPQAKAKSYEIQVKIQDTGIGIAGDRLPQLFQPFSQASRSTHRQYGGTGLGLVISQRLCHLMGGTLWVESADQIGGEPPAQWQIPDPHSPIEPAEPEAIATHTPVLMMRSPSLPQLSPIPNSSAFPSDPWISQSSAPHSIDATTTKQPPQPQPPSKPQSQPQSQPQGSTFYFTFQALGMNDWSETDLYADSPSPTSHPSSIPSTTTRNPTLKVDPHLAQKHPLRILLAEDNLVNQNVALLMLQRMGYEADIAIHGKEVLRSLQHTPYDLILMDLQMPEMDGLEATRQIHHHWLPHQRPHIVAITANAMSSDRDTCLATGMNGYLSKPIQIKALEEVLRQCPRRGEGEGEKGKGERGKGKGEGEKGKGKRGKAKGEGGEAKGKGEKGKEVQKSENSALIHPSTHPPIHPSTHLPIYPSTHPPTLNLQPLREMIGPHSTITIADIIDAFLDSVPQQIEEMRGAIAQNNAKQLEQAAHRVKSASGSLGAKKLFDLSRILEQLGHHGILNTETSVAHLGRLETEYEQVKVALLEERDR
jgi:PAS domain S-box-containing protein